MVNGTRTIDGWLVDENGAGCINNMDQAIHIKSDVLVVETVGATSEDNVQATARVPLTVVRAVLDWPKPHDLTPSEAAPTKIVVTRRFADYHAAIDGTDGRKWGCGKTIDEAVGSLVRNHPGVFDAIVDLEKVPRER